MIDIQNQQPNYHLHVQPNGDWKRGLTEGKNIREIS